MSCFEEVLSQPVELSNKEVWKLNGLSKRKTKKSSKKHLFLCLTCLLSSCSSKICSVEHGEGGLCTCWPTFSMAVGFSFLVEVFESKFLESAFSFPS